LSIGTDISNANVDRSTFIQASRIWNNTNIVGNSCVSTDLSGTTWPKFGKALDLMTTEDCAGKDFEAAGPQCYERREMARDIGQHPW